MWCSEVYSRRPCHCRPSSVPICCAWDTCDDFSANFINILFLLTPSCFFVSKVTSRAVSAALCCAHFSCKIRCVWARCADSSLKRAGLLCRWYHLFFPTTQGLYFSDDRITLPTDLFCAIPNRKACNAARHVGHLERKKASQSQPLHFFHFCLLLNSNHASIHAACVSE